MCLALPAEVISIERETETAVVALGGVKKEISVALLDEVDPGDFVLVHVGSRCTVSPRRPTARWR
jgi:hydrogenase expression/formation protein HypC